MSAPGPTGPLTPPEGRYGPPGRSMPKYLPVALIAVALIAVVPLTVAVYDRMNPPVQADVLGFDIEPNEATVRVRVEKPSGSSASCTLEARDVDSEIVGSRRLEVTGSDTVVTVERTFPTAREAITVEVVRCQED